MMHKKQMNTLLINFWRRSLRDLQIAVFFKKLINNDLILDSYCWSFVYRLNDKIHKINDYQ